MLKYVGAVSVLACMAASPALAVPFPATVTIDTSETHLPPDPGFSAIDVSSGSLPAGAMLPYHGASFTTGSGATAETISFVGMDGTQQGIVNGAGPGVYAPPVTNSSGATYGGNYFSTGNVGYIDISFASPEKALALLWGSVDATNEITFLSGGVTIATVLGSQISSNPNGNQGFGGSFYTLLNLDESFDEIRLSSGVVSFEAAEFEADPSNSFVSEPASAAVLVLGLAGLTMLRRRRRFGADEG